MAIARCRGQCQLLCGEIQAAALVTTAPVAPAVLLYRGGSPGFTAGAVTG